MKVPGPPLLFHDQRLYNSPGPTELPHRSENLTKSLAGL